MSSHPSFVLMYDFQETLGKGHFAVVKRAQHVISKEQVAVKIIDKGKLKPDELGHLQHEVRLMKCMRHGHIVRLYQVVDTKTNLYLILELGNGGDLYEYIRKHGKFDETRARKLFRQLVSAMSYCHNMHIVHRDLKAENVVFLDSETVKITDFGLSNNFSPGEKMKTSCGSLAYSPPEMLLQEPYDGPAVDVWSLGVILYMMVVGELPFQDHSDTSTVFKILDVKYPIPDYMTQSCQDLIAAMLVRDIDKRITTSDILKHEWVIGDDPDGVAWIEHYNGQSNSGLVLGEEEKEEVLRIMGQNDMDRAAILQSLESSDYDHMSSTFHLLAQRQLRLAAQTPPSADGHLSPGSSPQPKRNSNFDNAIASSIHLTAAAAVAAASTTSTVAGSSSSPSLTNQHKGSFARPLVRRVTSITPTTNFTQSSPISLLRPQPDSDIPPLSLSPRFATSTSLRTRPNRFTLEEEPEAVSPTPISTATCLPPPAIERSVSPDPSFRVESPGARRHVRTQSSPSKRIVRRVQLSEAAECEEGDDTIATRAITPNSLYTDDYYFSLERTTEKASRICSIL